MIRRLSSTRDCAAGNPSLEAWKVRPDSQAKLGRDRHHISSCCEEDDLDGEHEGVPAERSMLQQVPLASIGDTVVTLPEGHDVPPGELHSQHVEQPGQSWDEWPTNSLWGALAGTQLCCMVLCLVRGDITEHSHMQRLSHRGHIKCDCCLMQQVWCG